MISQKHFRRTLPRGFATPYGPMGFVSRLLATGLVLALIGLLTIVATAEDPAALLDFRLTPHPEISSAPVMLLPTYVETGPDPCRRPNLQPRSSCAAAAISTTQPVEAVVPAASKSTGHSKRGHNDSRVFLQDVASAMRVPGVRPPDRETRTELWINAPWMVGNTSPPEVNPASPPPER